MIIGIVVTVVFLFLLILSFRIAMGFGALITFSAAILASIILATSFLFCIAIGGIEKFKPLLIIIAGLMVIFQTLMIIFILQRKMKWRTREVLELAFDQLCQALGNLFIDFMDKFLNGEGEKIIDKFNSLKLNIITEG